MVLVGIFQGAGGEGGGGGRTLVRLWFLKPCKDDMRRTGGNFSPPKPLQTLNP